MLPWFSRKGKETGIISNDDLQALDGALSAEEIGAICVDWCSRVLQPMGCYAYLWSQEERHFRLSATATRAELTDPEPSYSGLMASSAGATQVPLTIQLQEVPPEVTLQTRGGETWLTAPCGSNLLLRVQIQRNRKLASQLLEAVEQFAMVAGPLVTAARRLESAKAEIERLKESLSASRVAAEAVTRPERSMDVLFQLPVNLLGAQHGGLVVVDADTGGSVIWAVHGKGQALVTQMLNGAAPALLDLPLEPDLVTGEKLGDLAAQEIVGAVRVPVILVDQVQGCAYYFFQSPPQLNAYQVAVLATLGERFAQVLSNAKVMAESAEQYLATLRALVTAMDAMAPHSVGHSDRLARYARMTARELGLQPGQIEAVALGAYLHDVGMVALDLNMINSAGRLTPDQYEQVKQHTNLGSELVAMVDSDLPVSQMVAHHHERWDGRGYPHRLRGNEIPIGARIISVCDLFEAKTTSRGSRHGLPFNQALDALKGAAGTQLDPDVVSAFLRAFRDLRKRATTGRPLAPCWVIRQVPASICGDCPNRVRESIPCWENPAKLCSRHGDDCATCEVYTEVLDRTAGVMNSGDN